jgi:hypothetical protein
MPPITSRSEARKHLQPAYDAVYQAYPIHQAYADGFNIFIDLVLDEGVSPQLLLDKAASYARNCDPQNLKYVPLLKSWLKSRRFDDEDLFTDQLVSTRTWFEKVYTEGDAAAVEKRYGFVFGDPPVPPGCADVGAWHADSRRSWIGAVARHVLHGDPLPED